MPRRVEHFSRVKYFGIEFEFELASDASRWQWESAVVDDDRSFLYYEDDYTVDLELPTKKMSRWSDFTKVAESFKVLFEDFGEKINLFPTKRSMGLHIHFSVKFKNGEYVADLTSRAKRLLMLSHIYDYLTYNPYRDGRWYRPCFSTDHYCALSDVKVTDYWWHMEYRVLSATIPQIARDVLRIVDVIFDRPLTSEEEKEFAYYTDIYNAWRRVYQVYADAEERIPIDEVLYDMYLLSMMFPEEWRVPFSLKWFFVVGETFDKLAKDLMQKFNMDRFQLTAYFLRHINEDFEDLGLIQQYVMDRFSSRVAKTLLSKRTTLGDLEKLLGFKGLSKYAVLRIRRTNLILKEKLGNKLKPEPMPLVMILKLAFKRGSIQNYISLLGPYLDGVIHILSDSQRRRYLVIRIAKFMRIIENVALNEQQLKLWNPIYKLLTEKLHFNTQQIRRDFGRWYLVITPEDLGKEGIEAVTAIFRLERPRRLWIRHGLVRMDEWGDPYYPQFVWLTTVIYNKDKEVDLEMIKRIASIYFTGVDSHTSEDELATKNLVVNNSLDLSLKAFGGE